MPSVTAGMVFDDGVKASSIREHWIFPACSPSVLPCHCPLDSGKPPAEPSSPCGVHCRGGENIDLSSLMYLQIGH